MDSPHPKAFQAEQLNPGANETRNKLEINYKLRQDFKIEFRKEIRTEILSFIFPLDFKYVWTECLDNMNGGFVASPRDLNSQINKDCLVWPPHHTPAHH